MAEAVRVIVVDDEPDLRAILADYLGKYGFSVRTAGDARELDAHLASAASIHRTDPQPAAPS
jgi:two-component system, OmpR family, response regulator